MTSPADDRSRFEDMIEREGYILPSPGELDQQYHAVTLSEHLVTVWTLPLIGERPLATGPLHPEPPLPDSTVSHPAEVDCASKLQQGVEAAQICVINGLAIMRNKVASLSQVREATALTLFINAAAGFTAQDQVSESAVSLLSSLFPLSPEFHVDILPSEHLPMDSSVALVVTFNVEGAVL